ncbi:hypothetical protein BCAH1134_C0462 (plasmid) [Bacillus cereus AH1134]|nr:hypothetical protein BCAH1134_C0462 [Bacillus cereus AH1134]
MNYKPKNQISYRYNRNRISVSKSSLYQNLTNSWMMVSSSPLLLLYCTKT